MSPHTHAHAVSEKRLPICIGLNLLITVAEVVGGILSGSLALLSDAMHNLNDTASLGISYVARRLGTRPADPHRTFGYQRAEILGAFTNLVILVVIALFLIREAVTRYFNPREIDAPIMLGVAVVGLAANVATALLLDAHLRVDEPNIQRLEEMKARVRTTLADEFDIRHSTLEFELPGSPCAGRDSP